MFSNDNISTNVELLQSINKAILDSKQSSGHFKEFNSLSIGMDENSTKYPYLMVAPMSETVTRLYSTGFADVIRKYQFIIRAMKPTQEASFGISNGLANNTKQFFSRKIQDSTWKLLALRNQKQIVFNSKVSDIMYDDYISVKEGVISQARLNVDFYCQIQTNTLSTISENIMFQTNIKETTKIIHEIINNYKASLLPEVKTLKYGSIEPISFFPAVTIIPLRSDLNSRFAGADTNESSYSIYVFTEFNNAPKSLYTNMDIIHKIREIMFANKFLLKRAFDYRLTEVKYGDIPLSSKNYFTSQLSVELSSFEPI